MRRKMVSLLLATALLLILGCMGFVLPLELLAYLFFGWIVYLYRVVPQVTVNASGVATAAVCLILLAVGVQAFFSWIHEQMRTAKQRDEIAISSPRWRWRWTGSLLGVLLLMFVAGMATTGIAHQVGWLISTRPLTASEGAWSAARCAQSINNLKQIGLGLRQYSGEHGSFPPAGTFDSIGRPLHGWQAAILPFVEQNDLHRRIDFRFPWTDVRNASAYQTKVPAYLNPGIEYSKDQAGYALSHYAGNAAILGGDAARTLKDVPDGGASTIMAGEVAGGFKPWGDPTNCRDPALGINRAPNGFGGPIVGRGLVPDGRRLGQVPEE